MKVKTSFFSLVSMLLLLASCGPQKTYTDTSASVFEIELEGYTLMSDSLRLQQKMQHNEGKKALLLQKINTNTAALVSLKMRIKKTPCPKEPCPEEPVPKGPIPKGPIPNPCPTGNCSMKIKLPLYILIADKVEKVKIVVRDMKGNVVEKLDNPTDVSGRFKESVIDIKKTGKFILQIDKRLATGENVSYELPVEFL